MMKKKFSLQLIYIYLKKKKHDLSDLTYCPFVPYLLSIPPLAIIDTFHPAVAILQGSWEILEHAMSACLSFYPRTLPHPHDLHPKYQFHFALSSRFSSSPLQSLCTFYTRVIASARQHASIVVRPLITQAVHSFQKKTDPCILEVISFLLEVFGSSESFTDLFAQSFEEVREYISLVQILTFMGRFCPISSLLILFGCRLLELLSKKYNQVEKLILLLLFLKWPTI